MPVTNYHTVNGRIRGESTAGVRTDYLTDALGSVVATVLLRSKRDKRPSLPTDTLPSSRSTASSPRALRRMRAGFPLLKGRFAIAVVVDRRRKAVKAPVRSL